MMTHDTRHALDALQQVLGPTPYRVDSASGPAVVSAKGLAVAILTGPGQSWTITLSTGPELEYVPKDRPHEDAGLWIHTTEHRTAFSRSLENALNNLEVARPSRCLECKNALGSAHCTRCPLWEVPHV